jgi:hypothetical protein
MTDDRLSSPPRDEPSLPDKVIAIHESLRDAKVRHALGGALALAYYADPRATIDIDLNIFLPAEEAERVIRALEAIGVDASELDRDALERDGQCRLWWGDNAVDLFFAYDPIHDEMRKLSRRVPFAEIAVPILAPEHLIVCKAMFDRRKDWMDIEAMLFAADDLDTAAAQAWLARMVGDSDHRVAHLRELAAQPAA